MQDSLETLWGIGRDGLDEEVPRSARYAHKWSISKPVWYCQNKLTRRLFKCTLETGNLQFLTVLRYVTLVDLHVYGPMLVSTQVNFPCKQSAPLVVFYSINLVHFSVVFLKLNLALPYFFPFLILDYNWIGKNLCRCVLIQYRLEDNWGDWGGKRSKQQETNIHFR